MSHWRKYQSKALTNTKKDLLAKALQEMGLELDMNIKSVSNSYGNDKVDAGLKKNGRALSIGLKFVEKDGEESVEVTGDFWNTGVDESKFTDTLAQTYQKHNVIKQCEDQGWTIDEDAINVDANGNITIDAYQWS